MKQITVGTSTGAQAATIIYENDVEGQIKIYNPARTYELDECCTAIIEGTEWLFRSKITGNTTAPAAASFINSGNWRMIGRTGARIFATLAAANAAITNTVVDGKNLRDGQVVYIGASGTYRAYWWSGGFADTNLVEQNDTLLPNDSYTIGTTSITSGSTASDRTYFYAVPIVRRSYLSGLTIRLNVAANIKIKRFTISADGLTYIYKGQTIIAGLAGTNSYVLDKGLAFDANDIIAIYTGAAVAVTAGTPWSAHYSSASVIDPTTDVTRSGLTLVSSIINANFTFSSVVLAKDDTVNDFTSTSAVKPLSAGAGKLLKTNIDDVAAVLTSTVVFGEAAITTTGTNGADRCYFIQSILPKKGTVKKVNIYCDNLGTLSIKRFSVTPTQYLFQSQVKVEIVATGMNHISIELPVEAGDILALYHTGLLTFDTANTFPGLYANAAIKDTVADVTRSGLSFASASIAANFEIAVLGVPGQSAVNDPLITPMTDFFIVPCYGQSLSINTDAGASTFSAPVPIAYNTSLVNTNIQDMNGGYAETFLAASREDRALPDNFKMITCLGGAGGKSVLQLSKGTTYYSNVINNITTAVSNIKAANIANGTNLSYNCPAIIWTQGEEDYRAGGAPLAYGTVPFDPYQYAANLKKLLDDFNTDIKAITGQTNHVKMIMYQVASHNPYARYPRIAMQQLTLCMADPRFSLAKTMYELDYNAADYVHAPAKSYRNMGNHYGLALYRATVRNERVLPITPANYYIVGTDVYIKFHAPVKPLVFDTTIVAPLTDGNYGFALYTVTNETLGASGTIAPAAQTITAVALYSADTVKISLSALPPAGTRLTYGVNGNGSTNISGTAAGTPTSGRNTGARGNLRDSRTNLNPVVNYFTLYNWCPIFEIVL